MSYSSMMALVLTVTAPQQAAAQQTISSLEQTTGGRHWVDAQLAPPKPPHETLKTFRLPPGLRIELVAAEPLVVDPVAIAFDHVGRMYVVEYRDYPNGPPSGQPPLSRIRVLEDTDGDGRMDQSHLFADQLDFAHSLMPWNEGVLTTSPTEIIFLKDTDGDLRADVRQVLYRGFKPDHPQRQIGNPRYGIDNWIYLNFGVGQVSSANDPDQPVEMPRLDFRFDPRTKKFEPDSGMGQYGNTIDNWGNRFFCSNRNPIMMSVIPWSAVRRNPFVVIPKAYDDVAAAGWETKVFPAVEMKSNWLAHAGTHTAACGVTAYRGDLLGPEYTNNVFVCEPIGHLITRSVIHQKGVSLRAVRARPHIDFLTSTDTWFLPGSLATGPDGALYVADMYRAYAEHPRFLPDEVSKKLDLRAGDDRGRIYRILPDNAQRRTYVPPQTVFDLVELLQDGNGWRRHVAQRLLVERQAVGAITELDRLLKESQHPQTRLHALWTLEGLGALERSQIEKALTDADAHIRKNAVRLSAGMLSTQPQILTWLLQLTDDDDVQVRFQVAIALGEIADTRATEALTKLAERDVSDPWFRLAILTSTEHRSAAVLSGLLAEDEFSRRATDAKIDMVRQLASVVGTRGNESELASLFDALVERDLTGSWCQTAALTGMAIGLARHRGSLGRTNLAKLLNHPPDELQDQAEGVRALFSSVADIAVNQQLALGDRLSAIGLLGYLPFDQAAEPLSQLLGPEQPAEIRTACLEAMAAANDVAVVPILLERWPTLGPDQRAPALELCLRRVPSTLMALEAMASGEVDPSAVSIDQRIRLVRHRDSQIRTLAVKLFGGTVSANRANVVNQYSQALAMKGDARSGAQVFQKNCATCHRIDGKGYQVGPDISDVRNKPSETLLHDILDPNRAIEPRYTQYTVATIDGRVFNGIIMSETNEAVVLLMAEAKQQIIPRIDIETIQASGKSLMPEGVESTVDVQQMSDLLIFLKSQATSGVP